uniref:Uncharacterized protein n=3 Tax=Timema TaxID=61471 RepID=A0A7R9EJA4_9NEOP|nr:unnamed protein product [Timema monikensis]
MQQRTLWSQIPEVQESQVIETMSRNQRQLQEAKFEIITSEASYINSLNILKNHFMTHLEQIDEIDFCREDRRILFSDVIQVRNLSEKFLSQLEECRRNDIFLRGIFKVISEVSQKDFKIYVDYCSYQNSRDRTLTRLLQQHQPTSTLREYAVGEVSERLGTLKYLENVLPARIRQPSVFAQTLSSLESSPVCQGLNLQSFLLVPMQRITKLQLLIGAVLNYMARDDEEYEDSKRALHLLNKVVHDCNEGVRSVERMEELMQLSKHLKFDRGIKTMPLYSSSRWLVKKGKLTELKPEYFNSRSIYVFIFNDMLFLARKRRLFPQHAERYLLLDHCTRENVRLMNTEALLHLPDKFSAGFCMLLTLLSNHKQKKISKLIYFTCESDRHRWTEALNPPQPERTSQIIKKIEDWPQVVVKWSYTAKQNDELSLEVSDIINVINKSSDGWYQGERVRDGEKGWFPGNYTVALVPEFMRNRANDRHAIMSVYCV